MAYRNKKPIGGQRRNGFIHVSTGDVLQGNIGFFGPLDEGLNPAIHLSVHRSIGPIHRDSIRFYTATGVKFIEAFIAPVVIGLGGMKRYLKDALG